MAADAIFLMFTLKKILYVKKSLCSKKKFDYFNSQVNNVEDMEREQLFFYRRKAIFGKNYKVDYYYDRKFMDHN